jgi:hypothetical protein
VMRVWLTNRQWRAQPSRTVPVAGPPVVASTPPHVGGGLSSRRRRYLGTSSASRGTICARVGVVRGSACRSGLPPRRPTSPSSSAAKRVSGIEMSTVAVRERSCRAMKRESGLLTNTWGRGRS